MPTPGPRPATTASAGVAWRVLADGVAGFRHRDPARFVRPREAVFTMGYQPAADQRQIGTQLVRDYKIAGVKELTSCSVCHR